MTKKLTSNQLRAVSKLLAATDRGFTAESRLFKEQLAFVRDSARFKTAVTTRRAGKSVACAVDLLGTALENPGTVGLYITLSRLNAKRIIWPMLLEFNRIYKLNAHTNDTEGSMQLPNGSVIYVSGAKDAKEIEKFRGLALKKCYLDEAQSFPPFIEQLVDEVISPALFDNNGTLALIGTPGPIPSGYFYQCSQSPEWSHHHWSLFDNPFIEDKSGKTAEELLKEELKRRGVLATDPKIQREFYGKWTTDFDSLVFKYNQQVNDYSDLPILSTPWTYCIGIDVGFNDADAIAVLAYNAESPDAYLVEEVIETKQDISSLVEVTQKLILKYNPESIVMDTGGLGRKIAEELQKRYSIPVKAADKARKAEHIELLNSAMRTRKFYAKSDSRFASDCAMVEWDKAKSTPDKLKISARFHSDICDAVLYTFMDLYNWLWAPQVPKAKRGSPEYYQALENEIINELEEQLRANLPEKKGISDD